MKILIGIIFLCFAYVNCAVVKATETNEEIFERVKKECEETVLGGRYVDPFDCQGYYRCVLGVLTKKDCAVGLGYDPESQMCQPKVEGCSITGIPEEIEETKEQILENIKEECYDFRDPVKRFIDPFHCARYYRCIGGMADYMECGRDEHYDPKTEVCTLGACVNK